MQRYTNVQDFPIEVLECIFAHLAASYTEKPRIDPYLRAITANTSSVLRRSSASRFEPSPPFQLNYTFHSVCLVCRKFYAAARRYLWSVVRITWPRSFQTLLENVCEDEVSAQAARLARTGGRLLSPSNSRPASRDRDWTRRSRSRSRDRRSFSGDRRPAIRSPPLSSRSSFDASEPRTAGFDEGARMAEALTVQLGRIRSLDDAPRGRSERIQDEEGERGRSQSVVRFAEQPTPVREVELENNDSGGPGLFMESLSFSNFRTSGLARTIGEGSQQRFVTAQRLLKLLRGTRALPHRSLVTEELSEFDPDMARGKLRALAFTEYMDSSLDINVIEEILLRGGLLICTANELSQRDSDYQGSALALAVTPLEALDFCGCISSRFLASLQRFLARYNLISENLANPNIKRVWFPFCKRLGLLDAALPSQVLQALVCSFPFLTHLDLAKTRANDFLLRQLAQAPCLRLKSLSLARCKGVTGAALIEFFCESLVTAELQELSLNGDDASPTPLTQVQLRTFLTSAHCMQSGKLRSLDLSSCPFTNDLLMLLRPSRADSDGQLLVLGLSCCRQITIAGVARLMFTQLTSVEVLDISKSCYVRAVLPVRDGPSLDILSLHRDLVTVLGKGSLQDGTRIANLRVIELDEKALEHVQGGVYGWRSIYGKGRRGWYVDTTISGRFEADGRRLLETVPKDSEVSATLQRIAGDSRNVQGNVGWNPFKVEVLNGLGRFGVEEGLFAYHSYQV